MTRVSRFAARHPRTVVAGWLVVALALFGAGHLIKPRYSDNLALAGSQAERAGDLLAKAFPNQRGETVPVVLVARHHYTFRSGPAAVALADLEGRLRELAGVRGVVGPQLGRSGQAALLELDLASPQPPPAVVKGVVKAVKGTARAAPVAAAAAGGRAVEATEGSSVDTATAVGLLAALVVLLLTFGSPLAAALPILSALAGLGAASGLIALTSRLFEMPSFSGELAAMVGLGVGIDYALFLLNRFRQELGEGAAVTEAVSVAMRSAGRAVLFAGLTVVISLLGMGLLGAGILAGAAAASALAVLAVVLSSLTLLPALLALCGRRLLRTPFSFARLTKGPWSWQRWSALLLRRPLWFAAVATVVIALLIAPVGSLQLGFSNGGEGRPGTTSYRAHSLIAKEFGPGANGRISVVARALQPGDNPAHTLALLRGALLRGGGVVAVSAVPRSENGRVAAITVQPAAGPQTAATKALVERLRRGLIPALEEAAPLEVLVGGVTAASLDFSAALEGRLPLFICIVSALAALLLLLAFRSPLLAIKASLLNLLSIGASLGIVVAVFQWGLLGPFSPFGKGPIESFLPVMVFAIVYGLSMDYEVFLLARIHERYHAGEEARSATASGLALSGPVITAAAAIMVCVFCSFIAGGERVIAEFGLALASAIFLDAGLIRCLLIPSLLGIVGERAWRGPALLRRLPPLLPEAERG